MSIPLERLYNYIDKVSQKICNDYLIIYHFYPHGSKKLEDLKLSRPTMLTWVDSYTKPSVICHDQEPLNHDMYTDQMIHDLVSQRFSNIFRGQYLIDIIDKMHLRAATERPINCYDLMLLTHSEQHSEDLIKYQNHGFVGIYWWSHAAIARDWFRYAEHVEQQKQVEKTFLIYNRAWTGTREYRLKFVDFLISNKIQSQCVTRFNSVDIETGEHYQIRKFKNVNWKPSQNLDGYFDSCQAGSDASADFDLNDYQRTHIEVVLETLFDDTRWHLTEKSLRPIALAQPFILAATAGSLEYLRSYGFKTYDSVWDESYDKIVDPLTRLQAIANLMLSISQWDEKTKTKKMQQVQKIADYNKKLFFSQEWQERIFDEYKLNFSRAWEILKKNRTGKYVLQLRGHAAHDGEWAKHLETDLPYRTKEEVQRVAEWIKQVN
jgi:hypothetical protein